MTPGTLTRLMRVRCPPLSFAPRCAPEIVIPSAGAPFFSKLAPLSRVFARTKVRLPESLPGRLLLRYGFDQCDHPVLPTCDWGDVMRGVDSAQEGKFPIGNKTAAPQNAGGGVKFTKRKNALERWLLLHQGHDIGHIRATFQSPSPPCAAA